MTNSLGKAFMTLIIMLSGICTIPAFGNELKSLSTADGLSDLLVNTIYKDSTGYLWFGTEAALDRFDGNHVKTFSLPQETSGSNRINAITELRRGEIFVGCNQGLFVLAPSSSELVKVRPEKISFAVNALVDDGKETLWIGSRQGIFKYNVVKNSMRHILLRHDILAQENEVSGLLMDSCGGVWISSLHSLHYIDSDDAIKSYPLPGRSSISKISSAKGRIYLGTRGDGVIPFDTITHEFLTPINLGNGIITSLMIEDADKIWASTDGEGIFGYSISEGKITDHFDTNPRSEMQLSSNSVYSMLVDDMGLFWVGYYQNGAGYTPKLNDIFEVYSYPDYIDTRNYAVRAVAVNGSQKVIGTREGLFFIDESTGRTAKFMKPDMRSNLIFAITESKGRYYIGTYMGGMYVLDPVSLTIYSVDGSDGVLKDATVFCIVPDKEGDLFIGTDKGLFVYNGTKELARYTVTNSKLPHNSVYEIFFDSTGRGWICTESGMAIMDGKTMHSDRFPKGFINKVKIRDICEDRDGILYFAPDRGEVFRSNLELTEFGPIPHGRSDEKMMTTFIAEDLDGWIWFGTDQGLTRFDKRSHFHLFNNADGIPGIVFTLCQPVRESNGNLWFGNSNGLLKLDFKKFKARRAEIHNDIRVTDITSNGKSIIDRMTGDSHTRQITLDNNENDLSVSFSNLGFIPSRYQVIEYQLDGYEEGWHKTDGSRNIHYFDLPSGNYMLRVRMHGDPDTEQVLRVHKSGGINWPLITGGVSALLLCGFIYFFYRARLRHREEMAMLEERAAEAASHLPENAEPDKKIRYRTTRLTDEECKRLIKVLDKIMKTQRPYTNPELKSADLAAMAGSTGHALSFLFNQYMKKSYYDYVNEYRVAEFKRLVAEGDTAKYTLSAMAAMCGFSSRASFFRHFKNITGVTPAEYMKGR